MSGGIDKIFPAPPHEIRGATPTDQSWIDETIEAGATCCGWTIAPRPNGLDAPKVSAPKISAPKAAAIAPKPKPKKKPWWKRRAPLTS